MAFAGGGALQVHNVSSRRTQDIDLFVQREKNVGKAATAIADALERAGYWVELISSDEGLWEFEVYPYPPLRAWQGKSPYPHEDPDPDSVQVQVTFFAYSDTVSKDIGPVVSLEYLATRKAVAIMDRHQIRDYVDIASLVDAGYEISQLLSMAFAEDPGLGQRDAEDVGAHLDRVSDGRIALELPPGKTPGWVRAVFAEWPRPSAQPGS